MSRQLTYTVVGDGSSDQALLPILKWAIHQLDPAVDLLEPTFVRRAGSLTSFFENFVTCDMLVFAHRDAESESLDERLREFEPIEREDVVPLVPVRMTEAWLLIDAQAIATAADAPAAAVELPRLKDLERLPDPKQTLESLLLDANGNPTGRKRKKFIGSLSARRRNVAELIQSFDPLRSLASFNAFYTALENSYPYRTGL